MRPPAATIDSEVQYLGTKLQQDGQSQAHNFRSPSLSSTHALSLTPLFVVGFGHRDKFQVPTGMGWNNKSDRVRCRESFDTVRPHAKKLSGRGNTDTAGLSGLSAWLSKGSARASPHQSPRGTVSADALPPPW